MRRRTLKVDAILPTVSLSRKDNRSQTDLPRHSKLLYSRVEENDHPPIERPPMITVEGLSKRFGQLRAVDRISFRVARGELFGFLGPNGAGKTTTISMISGLLKPDEGTVFIGEYNLWESPKAAKRLLGLVPQEPAFYEEFSARENLLFWGRL
jgi:ABC-2 type transport system ATP-binding protein